MNKIHKVIYCKSTQSWVVASEFSKSNGKSRSKGNACSSRSKSIPTALRGIAAAVLLSLGSQQALAIDAVCVDPNNINNTVGTTSTEDAQVACGRVLTL